MYEVTVNVEARGTVFENAVNETVAYEEEAKAGA